MCAEHSIPAGANAGFMPWRAGDWARASAGLWTGLLWLAALILLVRRWAGALEHALPAGLLAGAALLATAVAIAAQWPRIRRRPARAGDELACWLPALALAPIALALSVPGTSRTGLVMLWLVPVGAEAAIGYVRLVGRRQSSRQRPATLAEAPANSLAEPVAIDSEGNEATGDPHVVQQFTRRQTDEGDDLVEGWLRARLEAGQRTTQAHVSFCPPFAKTPELEFAQTDAQPARVKLGQLLPYGARFEVKLAGVGPAEVTIAYSARQRTPAAALAAHRPRA